MDITQKCRTASGQLAAGADVTVILAGTHDHLYDITKHAACQIRHPVVIKTSQPFGCALSQNIDIALAGEATAPDGEAAEFWRDHRVWLERRIFGGKEAQSERS